MNQQERNDLQDAIDKALAEICTENGGILEPDDVNLAELARRAGITRSRARTIKAHGFKVLPHGRTGSKASTTVLAPYADELDDLLARGVDNSTVCTKGSSREATPAGSPPSRTTSRRTATWCPLNAGWSPPARAAVRGTRRAPGSPTRWTGASCWWRTGPGTSRGWRASRWSATTAARPTSISSPTPGRRTCS